MIYLFLAGRVLLGVYFIMAGYNHFKNVAGLAGYAQSKGILMPRESVILSGLMMGFGGAGILLGVYIRISILLLTVFLFVASFKMHQYWKVTEPMQRMGEEINFKKNLALLGALLILLAIPLPWAMALF